MNVHAVSRTNLFIDEENDMGLCANGIQLI